MKIYADENIETSIIDGLRRRRITVYSASALGHRGKYDTFHLSKAGEMEAIVLTHDKDFDIYSELRTLHSEQASLSSTRFSKG